MPLRGYAWRIRPRNRLLSSKRLKRKQKWYVNFEAGKAIAPYLLVNEINGKLKKNLKTKI